jgi:hypothetical protein
MSITSYAQWYGGLPFSWLVQGPNGQLEAQSWPAFLDGIINLLFQARYQAYPNRCAPDALSHLGGDRKLAQGPFESQASFRARIQTAWGNSPITVTAPGLPEAQSGGPTSGWALAGTPLQLLEELYWGGFLGAVIVQQNGLAYNLSAAPTVGVDNSGLLTITPCSTLSVALTSNVTPPTNVQAGRSIPVSTPWWMFDSNTDLCNRFAILFPSVPPAFMITGHAVFDGTSASAPLTWSSSFTDTTYLTMAGPAVVTDGGPGVVVSVDGTSLTTTGATVEASDAFTGWVDVLAWPSGGNPFFTATTDMVSRLQTLIKTWRPNAICVGVNVLTSGEMIGWPPSDTIGDGDTFGGAVTVFAGA